MKQSTIDLAGAATSATLGLISAMTVGPDAWWLFLTATLLFFSAFVVSIVRGN